MFFLYIYFTEFIYHSFPSNSFRGTRSPLAWFFAKSQYSYGLPVCFAGQMMRHCSWRMLLLRYVVILYVLVLRQEQKKKKNLKAYFPCASMKLLWKILRKVHNDSHQTKLIWNSLWLEKQRVFIIIFFWFVNASAHISLIDVFAIGFLKSGLK